MSRRARIEETLRRLLEPTRISVVDESHRHAGHAEAPEGGESHYRVRIVSPRFAGRSRIDRQRLVNGALTGEFASGMHAIALTTLTPEEADPDR